MTRRGVFTVGGQAAGRPARSRRSRCRSSASRSRRSSRRRRRSGRRSATPTSSPRTSTAPSSSRSAAASARPARPPPTSARAPRTSTRTRTSTSPSRPAAPTSAARSASSAPPASSPAPATAAPTTSRASSSAARRCARSTASRPASSPARSRSARATASPTISSPSAPAIPASSPGASGNTSIRRDPRRRRRPEAMAKLRLAHPEPSASPRKPGQNGNRNGASANGDGEEKSVVVEKLKEAPRRPRRLGRRADRRHAVPHRHAPSQGAEGHQLVLHPGLGDDVRLRRPGADRRLPGDVLHAVAGRGLRLDHEPHQRRLHGRVRPRPPQVGRLGDDHPDLPPHGPRLLLRRLQVPARAQLGDRRRPDRPHARHGPHRLPPARSTSAPTGRRSSP